MIDGVFVKRAPQTGDTVEVDFIHDLMRRTKTGVITLMTSQAAEVEITRLPEEEGLPTTYRVQVDLRDVRPYVSYKDATEWLLSQMKLITVQDQGLGGAATDRQCWEAARRIALGAVSKLGDLR